MALLSDITGVGNIGLAGIPTVILGTTVSAAGGFNGSLGSAGRASIAATTGNFSGALGVTGAATFSSTVAGAFNGTLGATTAAAVHATTGSFSGGLDVTLDLKVLNGKLWLDDNGTHNGVINSPASLQINIDAGGGSTSEKFIIARDGTGAGAGSQLFKVEESGVATHYGNLLAGTDNTHTLGGASNRWSVVYAGTGTINTSDSREKTSVVALTADEIEASKRLGKEIGIFQWLASVDDKGDQARHHVGMTVQRAIEIMTGCNLDPMAYGFICYDKWEDAFFDHPEVLAVDAVAAVAVTEVSPVVKEVLAVGAADAWTEQTKWAGDRYGFRTDQLNSFIAAGFNARIEALEP